MYNFTEELYGLLLADAPNQDPRFPEITGLIIVLVGFFIILCNLVYNFTCNKYKRYQSVPKIRFYWLKLVIINTQQIGSLIFNFKKDHTNTSLCIKNCIHNYFGTRRKRYTIHNHQLSFDWNFFSNLASLTTYLS